MNLAMNLSLRTVQTSVKRRQAPVEFCENPETFVVEPAHEVGFEGRADLLLFDQEVVVAKPMPLREPHGRQRNEAVSAQCAPASARISAAVSEGARSAETAWIPGIRRIHLRW